MVLRVPRSEPHSPAPIGRATGGCGSWDASHQGAGVSRIGVGSRETGDGPAGDADGAEGEVVGPLSFAWKASIAAWSRWTAASQPCGLPEYENAVARSRPSARS